MSLKLLNSESLWTYPGRSLGKSMSYMSMSSHVSYVIYCATFLWACFASFVFWLILFCLVIFLLFVRRAGTREKKVQLDCWQLLCQAGRWTFFKHVPQTCILQRTEWCPALTGNQDVGISTPMEVRFSCLSQEETQQLRQVTRIISMPGTFVRNHPHLSTVSGSNTEGRPSSWWND